jgi:hypothetical protein
MDEFLKILEEMPVGTSSRIKIGENDYACKQLKNVRPKPSTRRSHLKN